MEEPYLMVLEFKLDLNITGQIKLEVSIVPVLKQFIHLHTYIINQEQIGLYIEHDIMNQENQILQSVHG